MKTTRRLISVLLCAVMLFSVACNKKENNAEEGIFEVWSKPSTVNVLQDVLYSDDFKDPAEFKVVGGRGEYEASQLIITAGSKINSYTLDVADLTSGTNTIAKEYIDIYNEKYINVISSPATHSSGLGWYADALLPMDKAIEYGENKIAKGNNQGIYIDIFIPRDVADGVYTGNFTLTVDGKTKIIPASVTVFDFEVSQESHLKTDWIAGLMGFGELDRTPEINNTYFKTIAGFRASTHGMSSGASDADEWLETVRVYTNPNLTDEQGKPLLGEKEVYLAQINLPSTYDASTGISHATFDTYISRLIKASIEDNYDYLAKAGCYMGFIDEPHYNNNWSKVKAVCEGFNQRRAYWAGVIAAKDIAIINSKSGGNLTAQDISVLEDSFLSKLTKSMSLVGNYVTSPVDDRLDNTVTTQFCIGTPHLGTAKELESLNNWTEEETSGNWWYAAGGSLFGNRIDSQPLEQRLSQWFTYDIGATGYLVWEVAQYQQITWNSAAGVNGYEPCDAYSLALRISNAAGDGYLFYPGKPYNIDAPVASIRAMQYRDSHEEYEYFYLLNQLYAEEGYSARAILTKIFATLYSNNQVTLDSHLFARQRQQLINLILLAQNGVFVTSYSEFNAQAKLNVQSRKENITSINGEQKSEKELEIVVDMTEANTNISFSTESGLGFTVYLGGRATMLFNTIPEVRGGEAEAEELEGLSATKLTFIKDDLIEEDLQNYDFTYSVNNSSFDRDANFIAVTLYNPTQSRVLVECWFMGTDGRTTSVDDIVLEHGYNTFYIARLDLVNWSAIRSITGIRFKIKLASDTDTLELFVCGVYAVKEN